MSNYIINDKTLCLIGVNNHRVNVIEIDNKFEVDENIKDIIENSCVYYGSSYKGRVDAASKILDTNYKVPILIEKASNSVFFPTTSSDSSFCSWISIKNIEYKTVDNNITTIHFKNGSKIILNISKYSIENQMLKSYILSSVIESRKF